MRRGTNIDEVGLNSVYLLSDMSSGVTGEVVHVDCGYHVVGMKAVDAPDISVEIKEEWPEVALGKFLKLQHGVKVMVKR